MLAASDHLRGELPRLLEQQGSIFSSTVPAIRACGPERRASARCDTLEIGRLIFHGGVPPAIVVEHVIRGREIQPRSAGLHGKDEVAVRAALPGIADHFVARLLRRASVEVHDIAAKALPEVRGEPISHFPELSEQERLVAGGDGLFEHLRDPRELARAVRQWACPKDTAPGDCRFAW